MSSIFNSNIISVSKKDEQQQDINFCMREYCSNYGTCIGSDKEYYCDDCYDKLQEEEEEDIRKNKVLQYYYITLAELEEKKEIYENLFNQLEEFKSEIKKTLQYLKKMKKRKDFNHYIDPHYIKAQDKFIQLKANKLIVNRKFVKYNKERYTHIKYKNEIDILINTIKTFKNAMINPIKCRLCQCEFNPDFIQSTFTIFCDNCNKEFDNTFPQFSDIKYKCYNNHVWWNVDLEHLQTLCLILMQSSETKSLISLYKLVTKIWRQQLHDRKIKASFVNCLGVDLIINYLKTRNVGEPSFILDRFKILSHCYKIQENKCNAFIPKGTYIHCEYGYDSHTAKDTGVKIYDYFPNAMGDIYIICCLVINRFYIELHNPDFPPEIIILIYSFLPNIPTHMLSSLRITYK